MRRVLVTGGSGFVGRNLAPALAERYEVLAPTHGELDLTDEDSVRAYLIAHPVDVVVHGATKPGHRAAADPSGVLDAHLRMFFNLTRCREHYGKLIDLGSGSVYDARHYRARMAEDYFDAHVPADPTGFSRYVAAKYGEKTGAIELRLFGVFGPFEDYSIRFVSNAICKCLFGLPVTLRRNRRFSYLDVADLAAVVEHFIENDASHPAYNVVPDETHDLLALAGLVRDVSGADVPIVVAEDGWGPEYTGDNARLRAEVPTLAFTPMEASIRRLHAWYEERRDDIDRDALLTDR